MEIQHSHQKTRSIWPEPGQNFYRFLRRVEAKDLPKTLAVLGCSDGTYVLPAARRGFEVLAIDIDPIALDGGVIKVGGQEVPVMGLRERLKRENLESNVKIINGDYVLRPDSQDYSGVFTSGSVHYRENSVHPLQNIIEALQAYVKPNGVLDFEYIYQTVQNHDPKRHYLTAAQVAGYFPSDYWTVTSHKRKHYIEEPNPRNPKIHEIVWGRLYAEKTSSYQK